NFGANPPTSDTEQFCVPRLDRLALFLHSGSIVLHGLDLGERLAAGLVPGLRMHRAQAADIDNELLHLLAQAEGLEQPRSLRMRRGLEDAVGADDQRRTFAGIDRLDGTARLLHLKDV